MISQHKYCFDLRPAIQDFILLLSEGEKEQKRQRKKQENHHQNDRKGEQKNEGSKNLL